VFLINVLVLLIYSQHNTKRFTIGYSDMFRLTRVIFRLILEPVNFSSLLFRVPKCLLLTVIFVSKAVDLWVVVDGPLSWCSFHFQLGWTTFLKSTLEKFTGSQISLKMTRVSRNMSL
jgi:hypothetical protein